MTVVLSSPLRQPPVLESDQKLSPLIVGVSGHRDIHPSCVAHAKTEVTDFLAALRALAPHTPIRVMVGMAEGADILVAEAALVLELPVDAVLPMPLEDYAQDFDGESLARLQHLLENPGVHTVVLTPPVGTEHDRDALYENLTETLIRKTNLLIALWDGEYSALRGGTGDTVLKYLEAHVGSATGEPITFIAEKDDIPWGQQAIFWVVVSRRSLPPKACETPRYLSGVGEHVLLIESRMPADLETQIIDLDRYNAEFLRLSDAGRLGMLDTLMGSLPGGISAEERANLQTIDAEYGKADALAVYCQHHSHRLFRWFSYMASAMGLLFLMYAKLIPNKTFLIAYLVVLLAGLGLFQFTKSRHWFSKHLAYRVLAETMRTMFFLRLTAADRRVSAEDLIELAGIDQFTGFSWITNVLKNVDPVTDLAAQDQTQQERNLEIVRKTWIEGQQSYFRAKVAQLERTHHRLELLKNGLLAALALITIILVVFSHDLGTLLFEAGFSAKDFLMFLMGLLPVWLGIWEIYQGKMATRELLWQYRNLLSHFSRAKIQLSQANDPGRRMTILADLGRDSLMESYLWTIHRYHREHEPPAAG